MGVTYKAFDVDLHCSVTLKVISKRYLGDESARLRFLREARAAASVRHPNVASVFHLGRTGQNYFYTMEFVEGKRSRRSRNPRTRASAIALRSGSFPTLSPGLAQWCISKSKRQQAFGAANLRKYFYGIRSEFSGAKVNYLII
jgi:serine/threonine protein kinase